MTSITVAFGSCTLAWPNRYGEIFLDFRGQGGFERLVDAVGGTRAGGMGNPFTFHFRVPVDSAPGASRLRVVTYRCQACFREESLHLNPCIAGEDNTVADLAVQIKPRPASTSLRISQAPAPPWHSPHAAYASPPPAGVGNCSSQCQCDAKDGCGGELSTTMPNVMLLSDSIGSRTDLGSGYFTNLKALLGPNADPVTGAGAAGNALVHHVGSYGKGICGTSFGAM